MEEIINNIEYNFELKDIENYKFSLLELPIFNRDRKIGEGTNKKYYLSKREDSFVEVKASYFENEKEFRNLNEFDEKIFYGLLKLYWASRNDYIITDYFEILKNSKIAYNGATFKRTADSIQRLRKTAVRTSNIRGLSDCEINLISELSIFERDDLKLYEDSSKEVAAKFFRNSKIKRVLFIKLNPMIVEEINKFDVDNINRLKKLNSKKLYILIQKWYETEKKGSFEKRFENIAAFLPFNWERTSVGRTIKYITEAFEELQELEMIKDYEVTRTKPYSESFIRFKIFESEFSKNEKDAFSKSFSEGLRRIIKENNKFLKEFTKEIKKISKNIEINSSMLKIEMMGKIFKKLHTIKGISKHLGLEEVWEIVTEVERNVDLCINGEVPFEVTLVNDIAKSVDRINKICEFRE